MARLGAQYRNPTSTVFVCGLFAASGMRVWAHGWHAGGDSMSVAYSTDLRVRVIESVEAGGSRREAAERFGISVSSAIRWLHEWAADGRTKAKPRGGSCSPLEEHASWLLALIAERPDLTLEEIVAEMGKRGIEGSRTAVWRFFERHDVSFKKNPVRQRAKPSRRSPSASALDPATALARHNRSGVSR